MNCFPPSAKSQIDTVQNGRMNDPIASLGQGHGVAEPTPIYDALAATLEPKGTSAVASAAEPGQPQTPDTQMPCHDHTEPPAPG